MQRQWQSHVVDAVCQQPLKYRPPDTPVTMGLAMGGSFLSTTMISSSLGSHGKLLAKEAINILWEVDDMSSVTILFMRQTVEGHDQ